MNHPSGNPGPDPGGEGSGDAEPTYADPSRRTYLAQERTLLAWWRTALATVAVALAVGRLLPEVAKLPKAPFAALGAAYGVLAVAFVLIGAMRQRTNERAMAERRFVRLEHRVVTGITIYLTVLVVVTVSAMFWGL